MKSPVNPRKRALARALRFSGVEKLLYMRQRLLCRQGFIRAVNYHSTPIESVDSFDQQLRFYQRKYSAVSLRDLKRFFETGQWHKPKPGLIISFDDAVHNNFAVAAPLLEKYGFTGWYFIPTDFCDTPPTDQIAFAKEHRISPAQALPDGRVAMTWEEVSSLARRHVIGSHTRSHCFFYPSVSEAQLAIETQDSKRILEERLADRVEVFCWVGGGTDTYSAKAMKLVREAGYRFVFTTIPLAITPQTSPLMLGRSNIESHWPTEIVAFQLSGAMDVLYRKKKRIVHRVLREGMEIGD